MQLPPRRRETRGATMLPFGSGGVVHALMRGLEALHHRQRTLIMIPPP